MDVCGADVSVSHAIASAGTLARALTHAKVALLLVESWLHIASREDNSH